MTALLKLFPLKTWLMIGGAVLVVALFVWWGNERHTQGVEETDAKWQLASDKLAADAAKSADAATRREAPRIAAHTAQVAAEKEKIDEAIAEGRSPLDALFPAAGGVRDDARSRPLSRRPTEWTAARSRRRTAPPCRRNT